MKIICFFTFCFYLCRKVKVGNSHESNKPVTNAEYACTDACGWWNMQIYLKTK